MPISKGIDIHEISQEVHTCNVFLNNPSDIGNISDYFQMEIKLSDQIPINKSYRCIPQKLYEEFKNYIDDLITNEWAKQSNLAYASPLVCVCQKDGSLRLHIDYRKLSNKTIPDRQAILKIQDMLDCLGGQQWFSALDMGKAYHQGYIHPDS